MLASRLISVSAQESAQVVRSSESARQVTPGVAEVPPKDQRHTRDNPVGDPAGDDVDRDEVELAEAQPGFVPLFRRSMLAR